MMKMFIPNGYRFKRKNTFVIIKNGQAILEIQCLKAQSKSLKLKKVQKKSSLKSYLGGNKVFIFWGAETMMPQTSNKLLKILEEPPVNTYFILITSSIQAILPTITVKFQT